MTFCARHFPSSGHWSFFYSCILCHLFVFVTGTNKPVFSPINTKRKLPSGICFFEGLFFPGINLMRLAFFKKSLFDALEEAD